MKPPHFWVISMGGRGFETLFCRRSDYPVMIRNRLSSLQCSGFCPGMIIFASILTQNAALPAGKVFIDFSGFFEYKGSLDESVIYVIECACVGL